MSWVEVLKINSDLKKTIDILIKEKAVINKSILTNIKVLNTEVINTIEK